MSSKFIDNKQFYELLKEYKLTKTESDDKYDLVKNRNIYNQLGVIFDAMAKKLLFSTKFINYSDDWKAEMYSEAVYHCCKYVDNFDVDTRNNPFAYFTRVIWNAFLQMLNKEKETRRQRQVICDKVWEEVFPNSVIDTIPSETE